MKRYFIVFQVNDPDSLPSEQVVRKLQELAAENRILLLKGIAVHLDDLAIRKPEKRRLVD